MYMCSDCKDRDRCWSWAGSSGHCDNVRCDNYLPEPVVVQKPKRPRKLVQTKMTKYLR